MEPVICACGRPIVGRGNRATRCLDCHKADPHYHDKRARRLPRMFVSVDCETEWSDELGRQVIQTLSFGREDGSAGTYFGNEARRLFVRLFDDCEGTYTDDNGVTYQQVCVSFHFGHDTAVLANNLPFDDLQIVRKVQKKIETGLCGANPEVPHECVQPGPKGLLHRYDATDVQAVLADGIHSDLCAWDPNTGLAMAFGTGQGAYLELRPQGDRYDDWRKLRIRDTGRAFIGGLEAVISSWNPELDDRQRAAIAWGKRARETGFEGASLRDIADYSEAECVAHARVCRKLLTCISMAAHVPMREDQLGGSGSIAAAVMKHYGVPKRSQTHTDERFDWLAIMDYFGGIIETPVVGLIQGCVNEKDINSAYPSRMIHMPCMREGHGRWDVQMSPESVPDGEIGHALVTWIVRDETSTPPFVVRRKDGRVAQPLVGQQVWVTLAELRDAKVRFPEVWIHKSVVWVPECDCGNPFEFLADLYNYRQTVRAEMKTPGLDSVRWHELDDIQRTIKLLINSIYGKLAQTRPEPGPYTNLHYASYITGSTRAQVRRETWEQEAQGGTVVYQHTDSVLSTGVDVLDGGSGLGAWGLEHPTQDFLIVQPGLAMALGNNGKTASRGARVRDFTGAAWDWHQRTDYTKHPVHWPKLEIKQDVMISLRLAMSRGKVHLAGSFEQKTTRISIVSPKRDFRQAEPLPGNPTAWKVPPVRLVDDGAASLEDIKVWKSSLDRRRKAGEFD